MATVTPPDDPKKPGTIALCIIVTGAAVVFVALRFYVRTSTKVGLGWDDWLLLAAIMLTILTNGLVFWASAVDPHGIWASEGVDPSYKFLPVDQLYVKILFTTTILYFAVSTSIKLAILFMYNKLFSGNRAFKQQLYLASFVILAWWSGCTVATLTNCIPLGRTWLNSSGDPRYCFNFNVFWMAAGAVEVVIDVLVLSTPIPTVLRLQLTKQNKTNVVMLFMLGAFVVVTGIIRTIKGYNPGHHQVLYSRAVFWTILHTGLGIICACLPILMPLVNPVARVIRRPAQRYRNWRHRDIEGSNRSKSGRQNYSGVEELGYGNAVQIELPQRPNYAKHNVVRVAEREWKE
ncbi:MAG: hypothetical protein M1820_004260 [Bogoriella megaspora]|nr:MAG: hypothetical protein M1820_004260 [Bogoriella megaspora]